ncbi:transport permease protein [Tsukamurella pulmonis]|uniref:Transport permease protein n=1 Tax=Tsukamurella pulmonis TaxID=47312 RepID=A0A1H1B6M3_9ACTN|nr:ABC transporter permease [Tsukamurella pulmonis]KXO94129.1 ABC transporter [Tsukamurella pulmonis]KXP11966.1 ABC transporter [Tsukamurella pulmonis]RDH12744.1 ABC transporter permease [Tsukamurella pulmonis]SDQ47579.1 ABC-2 type transport system permease protein [Tsukamurella pulmonis]SUP25556.1 Daunorubicin/doxorubicin resistance ABC transporter permease protein drrB [Tsukamurella pulmonis]
MTAITFPQERESSLGGFLSDCAVMTRRNLTTLVRIPQLLLGATVQPIMFVLLFSYVFGSALGGEVGGDRYREFLLAGILVQTVAFSSGPTAIGVASDMKNGIIDRFCSLPMSRLAVMVGRTISDLVVNVISVAVMLLVGLAVGWRMRGSWVDAAVSLSVLLLFGFAMSWLGALIGLSVSTPESAQALTMIVMFPIAFISSAFIASGDLPGPLRTIASWNPVTSMARSLREAFGNPLSPKPVVNEPMNWAAEHATAYSALASLAIIVVVVPLAARAYMKH